MRSKILYKRTLTRVLENTKNIIGTKTTGKGGIQKNELKSLCSKSKTTGSNSRHRVVSVSVSDDLGI